MKSFGHKIAVALLALGRKALGDERGEVNTKMFIGLILIAVAFIVFPIVLEGAQTILTDANLADYTGLETIVSIAPTLIFVGMLFGGGVMTYLGVKGK